MSMKTYIVMTEPYSRYGAGDPPTMQLVKAESLDELAKQLGYDTDTDAEELECCSPWQSLCAGNGDGADFVVISELVNGDALVEVQMSDDGASPLSDEEAAAEYAHDERVDRAENERANFQD